MGCLVGIDCLLNYSVCFILKRLHFKELIRPSPVNVRNRGKGGTNVYNFLSFHFLSAVVPTVLSKDRQSASRS